MGLFTPKPHPVEAVSAPLNDTDLAAALKESANQTAQLAGALKARGWTVSVDIYPDTSDKGPCASVCAYRTLKLLGE